MISNGVILLIAYLINIWLVLYWVNSSNCDKAEWKPQRKKRVVARTAFIYLLLALICWLFDFDVLDTILLLLGIILLFLMLIFLSGFLVDFVPLFDPIFDVLFEWIFDVQSKELFFSVNKKYEHSNTKLEYLIGKTARVESTLRPIGEVLIGEEKYVATSETDFIEKGTSVTVIAVKNSNLVVRGVEE